MGGHMDWTAVGVEVAIIGILGAIVAWVVRHVKSDVKEHAERLDGDIDGIHDRINGVVASAADTIKRMEYEQRMGAIETRFESRISSMEHKIDEGFRGINGRLDNLLKRD